MGQTHAVLLVGERGLSVSESCPVCVPVQKVFLYIFPDIYIHKTYTLGLIVINCTRKIGTIEQQVEREKKKKIRRTLKS